MEFSRFFNSKFKIIEVVISIIIFSLLIVFISGRLAFLISVLNRVFSPATPLAEKVEINAEALKSLGDKISATPLSR